MTAAVRALTWEIFARYRWIFGVSAAYLLALCLVVPLLPEWARQREVALLLIAPLILAATCLLSTLAYGEETQLEETSGALPRRLLLLPVGTHVLVLIPLVLSLVLFVSLWGGLALWVLRPCGLAAPLLWPGLLAASALAWLLALCWTPVPFRWMRLGLIVLWAAGFLFGTILLLEKVRPSESTLSLLLAGLWPPAVGLALIGARRARWGACAAGWGVAALFAPAGSAGPALAPFRSPLASLLWLEWRLHGRPILYLSLFYLTLLLPAVILTEYVLRVNPYLFQAIPKTPTMGALGPAWLALSWYLMAPLIYVLAGGGGAGVYEQKPSEFGVPTFVAVRPVSNEDLVKGKFIAAALHLLLMWGLLIAVALAWVGLGGHAADMAGRLVEVCGSPALAVLVVLGLTAALYVSTYLIYIGSMWLGLFGWALGAVAPAILHVVYLVLGVLLAKEWRPDWLFWAEPGLWTLLALKVLSVAYLVRLNLARGLVRPPTLFAGLAIWAALAAPCAAGALGFGMGYVPALGVVVVLPLAQTLLAPAALHFGRHRAWA